MTFDRRSFLALCGATGVSFGLAPWLRGARAAATPTGPFFVTVHAGGGWDPTMLCDPKGTPTYESPSPVNTFLESDILDIGPFRVAPVSGHESFFSRFQDQLLVINGLDNQTVSHETGTRAIWSGSTDPNTPAFNALVAATANPQPTLAYLSNGGYDRTAGLVAPTRIPDADAIQELAYPDRWDVDEPDSLLLTPGATDRVIQARAERLARLREQETLPRAARAMDMLSQARSGENELANLAAYLPDDLDSSNNSLYRQAEVAMAAFRAGVSVSANLSIGGFDTHNDHDDNQSDALIDLLAGVQFVMDEAERQGIADKVVIMIGSDFGRTPYYNATSGKDHWPITSAMLMGPGIRGGRVIGATEHDMLAKNVDPSSLQVVESGGVTLTPAHLHASLRQLAGIADDPLVQPWEMGDPLPLFA